MDNNVVEMVPGIPKHVTPEETLRLALEDKLQYVVILGRDENDDLRIYSNTPDLKEAAFIAQRLILLVHSGAFDAVIEAV